MSTTVVVINADYQPHQVVTLKHAIGMICRQVVVVEEAEEGRTVGPFPFPKVVRLVKYVYMKFSKKGTPRYSRLGVLNRDNNTCAFCGNHATTVDHLIPKSRGGTSTWENSISACRKCNERKAARTPEEANMTLMFQPYVPSFFDLSK